MTINHLEHHDMRESLFHELSERRSDVISRPELIDLILHLHNKRDWPLDVEQYLSGLSEASRNLANEIVDTYRGEEYFKKFASALEMSTRKVLRESPDSGPDDN